MRRVAVALLLTVSLACVKEKPIPLPAKPAAPADTHDGGRLVRRLEGDVKTLNYLLQTTEDERQVLALLYDPLIELDRDLSPLPGVAARWEVLDGGKTYVLHLDPRANFSDGQPVRASDVVFTLNKVFEAESTQFAPWFDGLDREQTRAVGERTVRVVFKEAHAGRIFSFNIGVLPEHVYGKEKNFVRSSKVVGNGAYVLKKRERDRSLLLERRENYWRDKPAIKSVLFRPISDDAVAWKALQRGDVDVARINNEIWARVKDDPAVQQKIEFHFNYQLGYNAIVWNLADPLLGDVRVRRGLAMAFDRQAIIDKLYAGQARVVSGPFTSDLPEHNPEVAPIEFNPQAAAALLGSAGWRDSDGDGILDRDGKKFELTLLVLAGNAPSRDQGQVFQEALRGIGVRLELKALDAAAFYDLVLQRNYQAAYVSWVNEPDPDPSDLFHSKRLAPEGMNVTGYANEEADQLMDEAAAEPDSAHRLDLYRQLHELLARDQPYLWTLQVSEKWGVNRRVQNVQMARGYGLFLWYPDSKAWWLKP
jgi:peptide/nickel transport system substrate-binding protein